MIGIIFCRFKILSLPNLKYLLAVRLNILRVKLSPMKKYLLLFNFALLTAAIFAQTPRLALVEEFTGENCGPCASVNPGVNITLAKPINRKKVVPIKWQVPIPSAPTTTWSLYQTNSAEINWRYKSVGAGGYGYNNGAGIGSAPTFMFDGWMYIPGSITNTHCATAQSYTSAFSITMNRSWDATLSSVNLTVNIQATANFTAAGSLVFRTVMVERIVQFTTQPGNNGETEFRDVAIKSFPTLQSGVAMASNWVTGQTQTFTLNCPLPSYTRKKEEVAFVGFIQDNGNRKVAQSVRAEKQGIGLNDAEVVSMSPSPGIVCANGSVPRVIVIRNNGSNSITAFTLTPYVNAVAQTPVTWSGTLNNGAYQTLTLPSYTPTVGGGQTLGCKITGVSGGDSDMSNNDTTISFFSGLTATNLQVTEGFSGNFPPTNWGIINPDESMTWVKSNAAGGFGLSTESAFYNGIFHDRGDVDDLLLPPLDLTGSAIPIMKFDVAHVRRFYRSDTLEVLASADCGNSWTLLYQKQDSILSTSQFLALASSFTPSASEWRTETITLPGFNLPNVLVKFRIKNDAGNNVYLDNVNVTQSQPANVGLNSQALKGQEILVYPNPSNGFIHAAINSKESSLMIMSVLNSTGQLLMTEKTRLNAGENTVDLNLEEFPTGLYQLVITTNEQRLVKKISLNR